MKIFFPIYTTGFDPLQVDEKKRQKHQDRKCYAQSSTLKTQKIQISDLKKRVENIYILNKAEYPRYVTTLQILPLNYQPNHNSNRQSKSKNFSIQVMFAQRGKTGDDAGETKDKKQKPKRNLDHITYNGCG